MSGTISHGMNVTEVRALGAQLKQAAQEVTSMINALNGKIVNTSWVGPDASRFKDQWWPEHRAHLQKMSTDLAGFGDSANNNAAEQESTSNR
jgi:uncharacterized protein YukE